MKFGLRLCFQEKTQTANTNFVFFHKLKQLFFVFLFRNTALKANFMFMFWGCFENKNTNFVSWIINWGHCKSSLYETRITNRMICIRVMRMESSIFILKITTNKNVEWLSFEFLRYWKRMKNESNIQISTIVLAPLCVFVIRGCLVETALMNRMSHNFNAPRSVLCGRRGGGYQYVSPLRAAQLLSTGPREFVEVDHMG